MADDDETPFSLPVIPYFYHDIVARIIPGLIQLGLIAALAFYHLTGVPRSAQAQELGMKVKTIFHGSQLATALIVLAVAYFVGVLFEGVLGRWLLRYDWAFRCAATKVRQRNGLEGVKRTEQTFRLANEASSILESYEPQAPHFFARSTRFLAEAKMMTFSSVAIPIGLVAVGGTTGHWLPPGGRIGVAIVIVLFVFFVVAGFSRQQRRAVEILRCIEYLSLRQEPADAHARADVLWKQILAPDNGSTAHPMPVPPAA